MVEESRYLCDLLKDSGIKTPIYTSMKKLKASNAPQVGAVLLNGESLIRSSQKKNFVDQSGQKKRRYKLWSRDTVFRVAIAESSEEKCEAIATEFLKRIQKGIAIDGNWVNIEVGTLDWVDEADCILKSKVGLQFIVTFEGGIYEDKALKKAGLGEAGI